MIVKTCRDCPLFQKHPLSEMLGLLVPTKSGFCGYDKETQQAVGLRELGLPPGVLRDKTMAILGRRLEVKNVDLVPPDGCPLRDGDLTVTLGS